MRGDGRLEVVREEAEVTPEEAIIELPNRSINEEVHKWEVIQSLCKD